MNDNNGSGMKNAEMVVGAVSSTRLFLAASSSWSFSFNDNNNNINQARQWIAQGMFEFRQGNVLKSIVNFDQAEALEPRFRPYLWQRGLSYYYANDFAKARQQFQMDVSVNPLDVEEIVWDILAALQMNYSNNNTTVEFPIRDSMSLPKFQKDRRPIMNVIYKLFKGTGTEEELAKFTIISNSSSNAREQGQNTTSLASTEFYALFYLALYAEGRQEMTKARYYMLESLRTRYAMETNDYMVAVAKVHCQLRGWQ